MNLRRPARRHDQAAIWGAREVSTARSISPPSRKLTGVTSTRATAPAWMTANWPIPERWQRRKDRRPRHAGAISFSSSSHFPLKPYSNPIKPVALPPGRARLSTKPAPTGSRGPGTRPAQCGRLQQRSHGRAHDQDDVGRERNQFRRVFAHLGGIARGPAGVDAHVAAVDPAQYSSACKNAASRP